MVSQDFLFYWANYFHFTKTCTCIMIYICIVYLCIISLNCELTNLWIRTYWEWISIQFLWTQSDLQYFTHCLPVSVCLTLYLALPAATPILSPTYSILFKWPLSPNNESLSGEFLNFLAAYRVILTTTFILKFEFLFVKYLTNAPAQLCLHFFPG